MTTQSPTLTLENSLRAPRLAREFAAHVLDDWGRADRSDVVLLLVSELVTNSVRYTSGDIEVRLCSDDQGLYVEVEDADQHVPTIGNPESFSDRGRGLILIDALSQEWGTRPSAHGKSVWAKLANEEPSQR